EVRARRDLRPDVELPLLLAGGVEAVKDSLDVADVDAAFVHADGGLDRAGLELPFRFAGRQVDGVQEFVKGPDVGDTIDDRGGTFDAAAGAVLDGGVGPALHQLLGQGVGTDAGLRGVPTEGRPVGGGEKDGGED